MVAALASKLVSLLEFPSALFFFLFLLHPVSVSVSVVLLVRRYLLFAACSCLGFLGVVVVDVEFVVVTVSLFLLLPTLLGTLWAVVVVVAVAVAAAAAAAAVAAAAVLVLLLLVLLLGEGGVPLEKSKDSYWCWGVIPCYRKSELQLATLAALAFVKKKMHCAQWDIQLKKKNS